MEVSLSMKSCATLCGMVMLACAANAQAPYKPADVVQARHAQTNLWGQVRYRVLLDPLQLESLKEEAWHSGFVQKKPPAKRDGSGG